MGPAYVLVTALYVTAFALSLGLARTPLRGAHANAAAIVEGLKDAARYVWTKPDLLGAFSVALLINLLAFPFYLGLLPYAAKAVYDIGQSGLGYLAGAFALGALAGSLVVGANTMPLRAGRAMLASGALWFSWLGASLPFGSGAELLRHAARDRDRARLEPRHARARHGHAHPRHLGTAARPSRRRADHRARRLLGLHRLVCARRAGGDGGDRLPGPRRAVGRP